jgi:mannose-6-phosphate isomerase-like protein (cupin superfamily)
MAQTLHPIATPLITAALVFSFVGLSFSLPCLAQLPAGVVPITSEPNHKVKFDNGRVRMIEAALPQGKTSLFHEHQYDGFFVFFRSKGFASEPLQGKPVVTNLPAGTVLFIPAENGPYIHRVSAGSDEPALVSVLELMARTAGSTTASELRFPPFEIALENSRGRVYRLKLNPGKSSDVFTRPAGTAVFAISSGRISEKPEGKPIRMWDIEPGYFRWVDAKEELTIKNEGQVPVELVEIEVF